LNSKLQNDLLLRACRRRETERTPVWIMRQAGRYLPAYQQVRAKYDFTTMVRTPELAAEVTVQPVDYLGVDAAILFSDILVVPEALGMKLEFVEGQGPRFTQPLQSGKDLKRLHSVAGNLDYVYEAIRLTLERLAGQVPLIGFAGAPWTLAAYMIEGQGSRTFKNVKLWMYDHPGDLHNLLDLLTRTVVDHLQNQIRAGAHAVQVFDSWAGILSPEDFKRFSLPYLRQVVAGLQATGAPVILFARGAGHSLVALAATGADVLGIDWNTDLAMARDRVGLAVALQGNLDPCVLYAKPETIRREVARILEKFGPSPGHIFNLGHGILPDVPPENARAMVDAVKEISPRYHVQELEPEAVGK
jgi:uroporphyrinogen decarboxylase